MSTNEGNKSSVVIQVPANRQNRGHQPSKALDEGYQASGQLRPPTTTPNVGTTAVVPAASTTSSNKK